MSEAATAVGFVVLRLTASSFRADIELQAGPPKTKFVVLMQEVPGLCPLNRANGGTLTTNATGHGHAFATVPRVKGAKTFFVQLLPAGTSGSQYTSDRISVS
ncbi:MAG TPA: hypothetical protein VED84_08960 [Acidimicrobiales bacterium]|nr:hypothetical protein [Acidimicrobiales bacterium]